MAGLKLEDRVKLYEERIKQMQEKLEMIKIGGTNYYRQSNIIRYATIHKINVKIKNLIDYFDKLDYDVRFALSKKEVEILAYLILQGYTFTQLSKVLKLTKLSVMRYVSFLKILKIVASYNDETIELNPQVEFENDE